MRHSTIEKIEQFLSEVDEFVFTDKMFDPPYTVITGTDQYENPVVEYIKIEGRKAIFYSPKGETK